jgi:hypothetical protein
MKVMVALQDYEQHTLLLAEELATFLPCDCEMILK